MGQVTLSPGRSRKGRVFGADHARLLCGAIRPELVNRRGGAGRRRGHTGQPRSHSRVRRFAEGNGREGGAQSFALSCCPGSAWRVVGLSGQPVASSKDWDSCTF